MKTFFVLLVVLLSFAFPAQAETLKEFMALQKNIPRFEDYPAEKGLNRMAEAVDLDFYPDARNYQTVLTNGFKKPPNFAGQYVIVTHGCGSQCQRHWIISKETGEVADSFYTTDGLIYKLDSALLIANYDEKYHGPMDLSDFRHQYTISYYVMGSQGFKLLRDVILSGN